MHRCWLVLVVCPFLAGAGGPSKPIKVVVTKDNGVAVTAINGRGDIIGFEWVEEKATPGVLKQEPFLARGKDVTYLPVLKGYTATFPAGLSDDGVVVGRASRPAPMNVRVYLRNQAFVWDAKNGMRGLGALKDDWASFACGISADGKRISGYSVGDNRVRSCVWDRDGDGWKGTVLPHESPMINTTVVPISTDGKRVASTDGLIPCLWTLDDSGTWKREPIGPVDGMSTRGVNNEGTVVGVKQTGEGVSHAVTWSRKGGYRLIPEPKGYVTSEALAVNNAGIIVGTVDGPAGSKTLPRGFAEIDGKFTFIKDAGPNLVSATAINDENQVSGVMEMDDEEDEDRPRVPR